MVGIVRSSDMAVPAFSATPLVNAHSQLPPAPPKPAIVWHILDAGSLLGDRPCKPDMHVGQGKLPHLRETEGSRQPRANIDGDESNGA